VAAVNSMKRQQEFSLTYADLAEHDHATPAGGGAQGETTVYQNA
jgi:hypothetical protein